MKILLTHALRSEAGIIKQHYPSARREALPSELDFLSLNSQLDLLRIGVGPENVISSLSQLPEPEKYKLMIHFGVSGSLDDRLEIGSIVMGKRFLCDGKPELILAGTPDQADPMLLAVTFFTSPTPITDEPARLAACATGGQAVDMESYPVAEYCIKHGIPYLSLRCISDRAGATTASNFKQHYQAAASKLQTHILNHYLLPLKQPL